MSRRQPLPSDGFARMAVALVAAAIVMAALMAAPASARHRKKAERPAGPSIPALARMVDRIHDNTVRIARMTDLWYETPGFPHHFDPVRAALLRENQDLFLRVETDANRLLDPIRKEPPPGQVAYWQLLRDTVSGAQEARMLLWTDFRDQTIRKRLDALAQLPAPSSTLSRVKP